ncbi:uncharacterized protein GGS22DRAFT_184335 [Annulohypoxylon maeteangense]|uniref:uncharacterized protein n=1 Tax=Annulohypoxylon maeteangense TaxID=1927788 RepID=UPI0020078D98|nr:uncharacterized protein GGS22DRAFT_184335 [Annulohypoxylon maeteangense]KAI0888756.1 hypothetical protein GGS22DRAFT_184335 [Annulohypoxylon maeteangense]
MAPSQLSIDSLPNEIIINVLSSFPTRDLLPLAAVCRRFHGLVGRVHYSRLIEASRLQDHEMILECYHPSEKLSTPELFCEYLGTNGLTEAGDEANLGELNKLYTRFRPFLGDEKPQPRSPWQTKAIEEISTPRLPTHQIFLDSSELFSQMCTVTNLVKVGPRNGLFTSLANVTDSVVRVWRDWLKRAAENTAAGTQQQANSDIDDPSILWTDSSKTVGLRFKVVEDESVPAPVLFGRDEDPSVSYTLEYQELLIKANWLLLSYETSEAQQVTHAGKAVVIASL